MRSITYVLFLTFALLACNPNGSNTATAQTSQQRPNMLLGDFLPKELKQAPYNEWYNPIYEYTAINSKRATHLGKLLKAQDIEILGFVGSWCGDTKRELPALMKILEQANFDQEKLTLTGVNYSYQAPDGSNKKWNIRNVPTFILLKDGKEVGRFVERPKQSLLEDIIKILE